MYDELLKKLRRPSLWERSDAPFWDDWHISKGMLAAHLDEGDAASRAPATVEASVEWLCGVVKKGGRVLDLGCGPGLYTSRLSDRGYDVTGIDLSRRSIEYAREHDDKTQYILGSYLDIGLPSGFDAATLIYCDYAALTPSERDE